MSIYEIKRHKRKTIYGLDKHESNQTRTACLGTRWRNAVFWRGDLWIDQNKIFICLINWA